MKPKQIIQITSIVLMIASCGPIQDVEEDTPLEHQTEERIHSIHQGDVEILVIDDCQYIIYKEADGANKAYGYMSHKGNCTNPVHCYVTPPVEPTADTTSNYK